MHENDPAADMAFYDQANAAKRDTMHYQADTVYQFFDALIRSFHIGMMDRLSRASDHAAKPVFIVGMPPSGTTLAEQIIASIPGMHGSGELSAVANLARDADRIAEKIPMNLQNLCLIMALFSNAKILHIERDATDTCFSFYHQLFNGDVSFFYD